MGFIERDLHEVAIKYFTACRDSLQVAAICALQSLNCMEEQITDKSA